MNYKDGDLVLCKVVEVGKTAVSVVVEGDEKADGTIPVSEIAPGRIRNLRDYVIPNKRIVCKVLKVNSSGSLVLSLRRVSLKETKDIMDDHRKEKTSHKLLEVVISDSSKASDVYNKIIAGEQRKLRDILDDSSNREGILKKYLLNDHLQKLLKILSEKREKEKEVKVDIVLKSKKPEGLFDIKNVLSSCNCDVLYIAGGRYSLTVKADDYKRANAVINSDISVIEKSSKELGLEFQRIEK